MPEALSLILRLQSSQGHRSSYRRDEPALLTGRSEVASPVMAVRRDISTPVTAVRSDHKE